MTGRRCPAGCVTVAGCQFAYFMKDYPGVNILIPTSASCTGSVVEENYQQSFSSDLIPLGELPLDYNETDTVKIENARIFLAYTGYLTGTIYGEKGSKTELDSLSNVLDAWGINNSLVDYADSTLKRILYREEPAIVSGTEKPEPGATLLKGHAWIVEGYRIIKTIRHNFYYMSYVELTEEELKMLTLADYNGYDKWQLPDKILHYMNWGYDGYHDTWVSNSSWGGGRR